jgi:hypothetical protein
MFGPGSLAEISTAGSLRSSSTGCAATGFIGEYSQSVPEDFIARAVSLAQTSPERAQARVSTGREDPTVKHSIDSTLNWDPVLWKEYRGHLDRCYSQYCAATEFDRYNQPVRMQWPTMLQHYPPGGGYLRWHCERSSRSSAARALVFMTYLTTHHTGGTEFLYQQRTITARAGKTVIWPADWQYTHRSEPCAEQKIIITGWFEYL